MKKTRRLLRYHRPRTPNRHAYVLAVILKALDACCRNEAVRKDLMHFLDVLQKNSMIKMK
jgi:hypothetical protein